MKSYIIVTDKNKLSKYDKEVDDGNNVNDRVRFFNDVGRFFSGKLDISLSICNNEKRI